MYRLNNKKSIIYRAGVDRWDMRGQGFQLKDKYKLITPSVLGPVRVVLGVVFTRGGIDGALYLSRFRYGSPFLEQFLSTVLRPIARLLPVVYELLGYLRRRRSRFESFSGFALFETDRTLPSIFLRQRIQLHVRKFILKVDV